METFFTYCLAIKQSKKVDDVYELSEMEDVFIELVVALNKHFSIPFLNRVYNGKAIFRRHLGMIKRGVQTQKIAPSRNKYLEGLIETLNKKERLSKRQLLDNYVLNGYPKPE